MKKAFLIGRKNNSRWLLDKALLDNEINLDEVNVYNTWKNARKAIQLKNNGKDSAFDFGFIDIKSIAANEEIIQFLQNLSIMGVAMYGLTTESFGIKQSVEGLQIVPYESLSVTLRNRL